jgi:hypothetical protein
LFARVKDVSTLKNAVVAPIFAISFSFPNTIYIYLKDTKRHSLQKFSLLSKTFVLKAFTRQSFDYFFVSIIVFGGWHKIN